MPLEGHVDGGKASRPAVHRRGCHFWVIDYLIFASRNFRATRGTKLASPFNLARTSSAGPGYFLLAVIDEVLAEVMASCPKSNFSWSKYAAKGVASPTGRTTDAPVTVKRHRRKRHIAKAVIVQVSCSHCAACPTLVSRSISSSHCSLRSPRWPRSRMRPGPQRPRRASWRAMETNSRTRPCC